MLSRKAPNNAHLAAMFAEIVSVIERDPGVPTPADFQQVSELNETAATKAAAARSNAEHSSDGTVRVQAFPLAINPTETASENDHEH